MLVILFRKIGYHQRLVGVEIVCTFARTDCHIAAPIACRALEHIVIVQPSPSYLYGIVAKKRIISRRRSYSERQVMAVALCS